MTTTPDQAEQDAVRYHAMHCPDLPTSCVNYGVVDSETRKEVCRVWEADDCGKIANLLNASLAPTPTGQDRIAETAFRAIVEPELIEFRNKARADKVDDLALMTPVIKRLYAALNALPVEDMQAENERLREELDDCHRALQAWQDAAQYGE